MQQKFIKSKKINNIKSSKNIKKYWNSIKAINLRIIIKGVKQVALNITKQKNRIHFNHLIQKRHRKINLI